MTHEKFFFWKKITTQQLNKQQGILEVRHAEKHTLFH